MGREDCAKKKDVFSHRAIDDHPLEVADVVVLALELSLQKAARFGLVF